MNIKEDNAGFVTEQHILSKGFKIFEVIEGNDMGQSSFSLPQFTNDKINIIGGYWTYMITDTKTNERLWEGWWNSNEEFDETLKTITNE